MFPGVVPRSFLGPAVVSVVASPLVSAQTAAFTAMNPQWQSHPESTRHYAQITVRLVLALLVTLAFRNFQLATSGVFGHTEANLLAVITAAQFHVPFYMSRPLPNIFALVLVLCGLASWLRGDHPRLINYFVPAVLIFRGELLVLLGPIMLGELVRSRITFAQMLSWGIAAGVVCLLVTVGFDSMFWGRWLWPEGEVLHYNVVLNKSSNWGVLPFAWYFYSAIPKAMSASLVLVPIAAYLDSRVIGLVAPPTLFVVLYSFLPHKELRFIIYVFPVLNLAAAIGLARLWRRKTWSLAALVGVLLVVSTACTTVFFTIASSRNYPGGVALQRAHAFDYASRGMVHPISVHIAVPPAQTGITRFGESLSGKFVYSKAETWSETVGPETFDLMLTGPEGPGVYSNRSSAFAVEVGGKNPFILFDLTSF